MRIVGDIKAHGLSCRGLLFAYVSGLLVLQPFRLGRFVGARVVFA